MILRNEDIEEVVVEAPEGHSHIRTTIRLSNGTSMTFQEATLSNILRAFVTVKTHPVRGKVVLEGRHMDPAGLKGGYAEWQLLEQEGEGQ